ncbi:hypothetical protein K3495_g2250 [Podosphaera aphanis]|nr:hypothetical protein K3495_g2250 [Podosphaera aphanis]
MALNGMEAVEEFGKLLQSMLGKALKVKQTDQVDPAIHKTDLSELLEQVNLIFPNSMHAETKKQVIDAAARTTFNSLLASTTIESPSFVNLWNLLDIISILSDDDQTEPGLLFWLIEELLDSQTISGCRKIFDYLESRREIITAKNFQSKNLIILRTCNELLRRLSRAEDTAFCGRVFIFLFQSFPLGDKSSVNLRGEYHTENVTTFDAITPREIRSEHTHPAFIPNPTRGSLTQKESFNRSFNNLSEDSLNISVLSYMKDTKHMSPDHLYPVFWSLQSYFSQPKRLFDRKTFSIFQAGLEATMVMFKSVQKENGIDRTAKTADDPKRNNKRKRGQGDEGFANTFNPKYLTSRDLFELEISDLSFRRHILVQSLIVIDFMLSLSGKSKEKLAKTTFENQNKSVMYTDQFLGEDETNWALEMKKFIAEYLKQSQDGPFFYRMVETVLSRDKNWVRWKIENCPSIARPAITPESFAEAKLSARKVTTNKRLRTNPIGSFDLTFLSESNSHRGLERLKDPSRYQVPTVISFKPKIELDDMDIEMAKDENEKIAAMQSKASKSWRALRVASTTKLSAFDKIERSDKIDDIFMEQTKPEENNNGEDETDEGDEQYRPRDKRVDNVNS